MVIGFVDVDGVKVNGVALKYDCDMGGVTLTADQYMLTACRRHGCFGLR